MKRFFIISLCSLISVYANAAKVWNIPGTLRETFDDLKLWGENELILSGSINGSDVKVLREWAGGGKTLDLSQCSIVSGGEPYFENYTTENDVIGSYMFADRSFYKLVLPKNLKKIGDYALSYCGEEIAFPATLTWIGDHAFVSNNFVKLHIPSTITHIGNGAFNGNIMLEQVTLDAENPEFVLENGYLYSRDHTRLMAYFASTSSQAENFTINPKVKIIDDKAFNGHRAKNITLNDGLEYIGEEAFKLVTNIVPHQSKLVIPNSVNYIGAGAFEECHMDSVIISDNVDNLRDYVFAGCCIFFIHMPAKLKYIGNKALCNNIINNLEIPDGVETIGSCAFSRSEVKHLVVPESVRHIEEECFNYTLIESIEIKAPLEIIPRKAFVGCQMMKKIILPLTLKVIGESAFSVCRELEDCKLPEGLEEIGSYAFTECSNINEWHIPSSVRKIEQRAISADKTHCNVYMYAQEPPVDTHEWAFQSLSMGNTVLYVPKGSLEKYNTKAPWSNFGTIREFDPSGINSPSFNHEGLPVRIYNLSGHLLKSESKGLQIVITQDSKAKKVHRQ